MAFESSTESGVDSNSVSFSSGFPSANNRQAFGLGIRIREKPLPDIPLSAKERAKQTTLDRFLNVNQLQQVYQDPNSPGEHVVSYQMGFSFQPGDDTDILAKSTESDRSKRKTLDEHLDDRVALVSTPESRPGTSSSKETPHHPRGTPKTDFKSKLPAIGKPSYVSRVQEHDQLNRMDSTSSMITAVRDNSGRSSTNGSQNNSQAGTGRPKLNRNAGAGTGSGSSEAVTAAARALAANSKRSPRECRTGSGSHAEGGNEVEGSKSTIDSRATSSADSSTNGSEAGTKVVGSVRRNDKSCNC